MKYIRYRRKSSEQKERQALSIDSQKRELETKFPDLQIVADLEESKSAFYPSNRSKFTEMIEMIENGEADGIIAWHPDRLSRNEIDAAKITYLVRTGVIKDIKFGSYHFDQSPEGIMMLQIALCQSQYFSSKLGKDVKRGLKTKAEKGWYPAMAPAGYMHDPLAQKGNKKILKDPERFDLVNKAIHLVIEGVMPMKALHRLNNEWGLRTRKMGKLGGKPLSKSGWYRLLSSSFYYGEYEYPKNSGNWYRGKHEPMITRGEYNIMQQRLGKQGNKRPQRREFAFTGLMRCGECGCMITAEEKWQCICANCKTKFSSTHKTVCPNCNTDISEMNNPTISHYVYYHCTKKKKELQCVQGCIRKEKLESQIDDFLGKIQISERFREWAIKYLRKAHEQECQDRTSISHSIQDAYDESQNKLDKLLDMKLSDQITDEEYKRKKNELQKEKRGLEEQLKDTSGRQDSWLSMAERTFDFACHARYWFENGTKEDKRIILETIGSNLILKDRKLRIEAPEPFIIIKKAKKEVLEISPKFEPEKQGLTEAQMEQFYYSNPLLLRR